MESEPQRNRLPFEPNKKRQKSVKNATKPSKTAKNQDSQPQTSQKSSNDSPEAAEKSDRTLLTKEGMVIPKVVSDRMARRMVLFCGAPTVLGMATFIFSYVIKSHAWFNLPNLVVLLVSIGFFGLGVLGLSYGLLSTSWDEERLGSKLGWREFTLNWGRMVSAWRSTRQKSV